ncbi:hypothetical protein AO385_2066 [Moraxella catarrhalis]|uniref:Uncharacterized protein n=1 Tax=Moraxella catarrhalis TaxID=480 RepID=A0A198UJG0_MORCA|nr:hypothetical protein AO385_2066 [Moraxella catarrhalis]OAU95372.1 hypothetical protein AO384_1563 [Moraxella catarrhalis]OAU98246.1 hypothetical protein AO383_0702 [Moraxella catarrhalis]
MSIKLDPKMLFLSKIQSKLGIKFKNLLQFNHLYSPQNLDK